MNNNRDYTVTTIEEYVDVLKTIQSIEQNPLWYRGQMTSFWHLDPTLFRDNLCYETTDHYGTLIIPKSRTHRECGQEVSFPNQFTMLKVFKDEVIKNNLEPACKMNDMEWLCFAQHYGMPTSLLDWTEDPMVGLFFAINGIQLPINESNIDDEARVYIINPYVYNGYCNCIVKSNNGESKRLTEPLPVCDSTNQFLIDYSRNDYLPICIKSKKLGYRMCRQSGNFMFYSSQIKPIDTYSSTEINKFMYTIHIPYSEVSYFSSCLNVLNLNNSSIYGETTELDIAGNTAKESGERQIYKILETIKASINS